MRSPPLCAPRQVRCSLGSTSRPTCGFADVCGEVAAICHAVAHGYRDLETIVALTGDGADQVQLMAPCGRCREVISDFNRSAWVIVGTIDRPYKLRVSELLPLKP